MMRGSGRCRSLTSEYHRREERSARALTTTPYAETSAEDHSKLIRETAVAHTNIAKR